eukprot:704536-Prymnesium_polylepis.1
MSAIDQQGDGFRCANGSGVAFELLPECVVVPAVSGATRTPPEMGVPRNEVAVRTVRLYGAPDLDAPTER